MDLEFENGENKIITVPFNDISSNGAYCVNEKSKALEDVNSVTIEWQK